MSKVAKLVYVNLLVRVVVDSDATEQEIMEQAVPKLSEQLMDSPLENIEKIIDDLEVPYGRGLNQDLMIGDKVDVPSPNDDTYNHEFTGTIVSFRNGGLATVEDGDNDCFDVEVERLTLSE